KINGDDGLTYKEIIDKKKDLMDMNINEIFKLEAPFNILYFLYYEISDEHPNCEKNLKFAKNFADQFNDLNNDSKNIEKSSFSQILSTLSDDYNNLKNKCGNKCSNFPSISQLTPKKKPVESSLQTSEGTLSSPSILKKVIPVLSTFSVISLFLVVSYKVNNK
ncbi:Plasmodium variant antigen protein Cir/Yir/Bir, putative, partial [Plasmodium chabaudi adami]